MSSIILYTDFFNLMPDISLPYCAPDEIETLNKAISYIFTDMQTPERHEHALNCYQTTYKRAGALRQWLEQVLNSTIARDLQELTEECKNRASELRAERIKLIRKRIKEITGRDIDYDGGTPFDLRGLTFNFSNAIIENTYRNVLIINR